jgi:hypothetical protein
MAVSSGLPDGGVESVQGVVYVKPDSNPERLYVNAGEG